MLTRWRMHGDDDAQRTTARHLAAELGVSPLVALLLVRRGLSDAELGHAFLEPKLTDLHDPALLPGVETAAARLNRAVVDRQPIVIYGDYDVDGITASAILWHVLTAAGANVTTYVPHRIDEGYGLNTEAIAQLCANGGGEKPLIVSVDCGITAAEPAAVAKDAGVDLIITDHHEFDEHDLPEAYVLVHPRLGERPYPFAALCGAGVAFKLAWQFAKVHCGSDRLPAEFRDLLLNLLSLAALGTVADVVPLIGENRVITRFGLGQIKRTPFAGLNALIDHVRLRDEKIDAFHVGFVIGPRLNACGRMGHAGDAVHLLTAVDEAEAVELAAAVSKINDHRKSTERAIFKQARQQVLDRGYDSPDCRAIILADPDWHPGVLGIVASRLVDEFARPAVLLNVGNGEARGSARSVPGVSIHDALLHCSQHLTSFGGHAMAAGLRLAANGVDAFRDALVDYVNQRLSEDELTGLIEIDAVCDMDELSLQLFEQIMTLAPFGKANPSPILCVRDVRLAQPAQRIGASGGHLRLLFGRSQQRMVQAVGFRMGHLADDLPAGSRLDVVFAPSISTYLGYPRMDLHVKDLRKVEQ